MRAVLIALLFCAVPVGSASAQSAHLFRGVFSITKTSDECVGVSAGERGLIRFSAAANGSRSAFTLFQDSVAQSFMLDTGLFERAYKPVRSLVVQASFRQPGNEVSVKLTRQRPAVLQANTSFLTFTGSIDGYGGVEGCEARFRAALTKNID